jgi:hypothetical protein
MGFGKACNRRRAAGRKRQRGRSGEGVRERTLLAGWPEMMAAPHVRQCLRIRSGSACEGGDGCRWLARTEEWPQRSARIAKNQSDSHLRLLRFFAANPFCSSRRHSQSPLFPHLICSDRTRNAH